MEIKMVGTDPAKTPHLVHLTSRTYAADNAHEFDVEPGDVADMTKHGLVTKEEAELKARLAALPPRAAKAK